MYMIVRLGQIIHLVYVRIAWTDQEWYPQAVGVTDLISYANRAARNRSNCQRKGLVLLVRHFSPQA